MCRPEAEFAKALSAHDQWTPAPRDAGVAGDTGELVSVVVPVYNGSRFLNETLHSVRQQTHRNLQLIVVDDGSTDDSTGVLQRSGVPHRLLRTTRAGVCAARNTGLAAAEGRYVAFLDQDDIWFADHLQRQLSALRAHPQAGVAVSPYRHWWPNKGTYPLCERGEVLDDETGHPLTQPEFCGWVYHQFLVDCWALTSATLIERSLLNRSGGFDTSLSYGEDWDLWLRLSREAQFVTLQGPAVYYRQHPRQGSRLIRATDFRTNLLLGSAARYGLQSPDGRGLSRIEFNRIIARYQASFGYLQLMAGRRRLGVRELWRAWLRDPARARPLGLAIASCLGWSPRTASSEPLGIEASSEEPR